MVCSLSLSGRGSG